MPLYCYFYAVFYRFVAALLMLLWLCCWRFADGDPHLVYCYFIAAELLLYYYWAIIALLL